MYAFFWVIPRRLNFICRRLGTLCSIFIGRYTHLPAYEDGTGCSETSAYKIKTPGNHPKERIQHSGHGESLKSRDCIVVYISCASAGFVYELLQIVCTLTVATFVVVSLPCVVFAVLRTAYNKCKQRLLMKLYWINAE